MASSVSPIEVLAPAGTLQHLDAAIAAGADAVYVGLKGLSSRPDAWSLGVDEIAAAAERLHAAGRRLYVAINAEFNTHQETSTAAALEAMCRVDVDAFIVGDLGLLQFLRRLNNSVPIHASCLLGIYNPQGFRFLAEKYRIRRVILNTHLFLDEIAEIHFACPEIELEMIAHGGVCFHDSRRCRKPHYICQGEFCVGCKQHYVVLPTLEAQPAVKGEAFIPLLGRRPEAGERIPLVPGTASERFRRETPVLGDRLVWSPEIDLSGLVGLFMKLGVVSFKIEGRTRTASYVAESTTRMRQAVDRVLVSPELQDPELNAFFYLAHHARMQNRQWTRSPSS